jgi:hypothetical protein
MGTPQIPKTQQDALPLQTIGDAIATNADTVTFIGNVIIKKWGPASTGINGQSSNVADPTGLAGHSYLLSNWLDFTGMTRFTAYLGVTITAAGGNATTNWIVRAIGASVVAAGVVVEPNAFGSPDIRNLLGTYGASAFPQVGVLNVGILTGLATFPTNASATCGWMVGGPSIGGQPSMGASGSVRLWLDSSSGADPKLNYLTVIAEA